jgi:hypothetical protein
MFTTRAAFFPALLALGITASVPFTLAVSVDGKKLDARGTGECKHAPMAAIYGVRSAMWRAEFRGDGRSDVRYATLTMWHPMSGNAPDQMNFSLSTRKGKYSIQTVKSAPEQSGSGTIVFEKAGAGGRFVIKGKTAEAQTVDATFTCERITPLEAVGG